MAESVAVGSSEGAMNTKATSEEQLITRWVEPNPHTAALAEAWVLPHCVSVWTVIRQLELDAGQIADVAGAYDIPDEAVQAAIAYYHRHKQEIDARIHEHRAFFGV